MAHAANNVPDLLSQTFYRDHRVCFFSKWYPGVYLQQVFENPKTPRSPIISNLAGFNGLAE